MYYRSRAVLVSLGFLAAGMTGCDSSESVGDGLQLVVPGKADNYYSNVAAEFELTGSIEVDLSEEARADEALRDQQIQQRLTAVGLYLTAYLTDKFEGIDINDNGMIDADERFFHNVEYGGFQAMVRNYSLETEDIEVLENGRVSVKFTIDVGGPSNFIEQLLAKGARDDDGVRFDLRMPAGATSDAESVARREIRNFDADNYTGELETIELRVEQLPTLSDAYPHYADFMADGVYDITMVFGYDYNTPRSDIKESRETFVHLVSRGFQAPAASYDALTADSGPFTKTVSFNGSDVVIEVRLFHADMFIDDRPAQKQRAIDELVARDVFFYNGHAGPYFGLYLDKEHAADVGYREIEELPMPEKQQLFVAQGCQTYSQYADMIYANPNKSEANLDAITTVNYSYGIGTLALFDNLTAFEQDGTFRPSTFYEIVTDLNSEYWNRAKSVFYGVMGLDGNPQVHPLARLDSVGTACGEHSDCGSTTDANLCLALSDGNSQCVARTLGSACPAGTRYGEFADQDTIIGGICY